MSASSSSPAARRGRRSRLAVLALLTALAASSAGAARADGSESAEGAHPAEVQHPESESCEAGEREAPVSTSRLTVRHKVAVPCPPQPVDGPIATVTKLNDADGDAVFGVDETVDQPGLDVVFQLTIVNSSAFGVDVLSVTDSLVGLVAVPVSCVATGPLHPTTPVATIAAGGSATCTYTLAGYSPEVGQMKVNVATVQLRKTGGGPTAAVTSAPSTVRTRLPAATVVKTNNADGSAIEGDNFSVDEIAAAAGAPVRFRVRVTNTNAYPVHVDGLTDSIDGSARTAVSCDSPLGTLAVGASGDCFFTIPGYSPADSATRSDVVAVTLSKAAAGPSALPATVLSNASMVTTRVPLTAVVTKTNNADGDDSFTADEVSTTVGKAVPFRLHIVNTSSVPVVVDSVTDAIVGTHAPPVAVSCTPAMTAAIVPQGSADCSFTLPSYAPADSLTKSNVATVDLRRPSASALLRLAQVRPARLHLAALAPPTSVLSTASSVTTHVPVLAAPVPAAPVPAAAPPVPIAVPPVVLPPADAGQDLGVHKTGPGSAHPGDELIWTIDVINHRGPAATGFTITDVLPAGVAYSLATGTDFACSLAGATVSCRYTGSLPVGSSARVALRGLLLEGFSGTTVANSAGLDPDSNPANDSSTAVTEVTTVPAALPAGATAGEPIAGGGAAAGAGPPAVAPQPPPAIPFTGAPLDLLLLGGVGLLLAGLLLALLARRRRLAVAGRWPVGSPNGP